MANTQLCVSSCEKVFYDYFILSQTGVETPTQPKRTQKYVCMCIQNLQIVKKIWICMKGIVRNAK